MEAIKTVLREIYVTVLQLDIAPAELADVHLIANLGIDSIITLEILTQVENRFGIIVEDDDMTPGLVDSLDALADYVANRQGG